MKKRNLSNLKTILVMFALVALVLFYVNHLSNRSSKRRTQKQADELAQLTDYNMSLDYPNTPRDVVKLHSRYFKMFYTASLSDEELMKLNDKVRCLYCAELLAINPIENSITRLKSDIAKMKDASYTYKSYSLPEASQVKFFTQDGREMATLDVTITLDMSNKEIGYMAVQYFLIKENNVWKIYGWGGAREPNIL